MPAGKLNYLVIYEGESQIYGSASKNVALESPPPTGLTLDEKHIYFVTHHPDTGEVVVHELPREEVLTAEVKVKKSKNVQEENLPKT